MSNFPALKFFNLTTPERVTIKTKDLPNYASQFYSAADDKIVFTVPTAGEKIQSTENSTYPRCEFRETKEDGTLNNWDATKAQDHWMDYHLAVEQPGPARKLIIGQIHNRTETPLCKVQWNDEDNNGSADVVLQYRKEFEGSETKITIKSGVKLGQILQLRIRLTSEFILVIYDSGKEVARAQLSKASYTKAKDLFYFKVGAYVQTVVNAKPGTGIVSLYKLDLYHGDAVAPVKTPAVPVNEPDPTPKPVEPLPGEIQVPEPDEDLSLDEELQDQIDQVGLDYRSTKLTSVQAGTELNALSKQVAKVPDDKLRAPLYAKIKEIKATL